MTYFVGYSREMILLPYELICGGTFVSHKVDAGGGTLDRKYPAKSYFTICLLTLVLGLPDASHGSVRPSSPKSRQAVAWQQPALEQDLVAKGFSWGRPMFVRIFKAERQLEVWLKQGDRFKRYKSYSICTYGGKGLGPKTREGDGRAPEGFYVVSPHQINTSSRYHLAFNLGYPNAYDRYHGYTGSALMVHGGCVSIGCFAMTDTAMEEIYTLVDAALKNGQPFFSVHIFPFKMNQKNMRAHGNSRWIGFWRDLKVGYDRFSDQGHIPPNVIVEQGRYLFENDRDAK